MNLHVIFHPFHIANFAHLYFYQAVFHIDKKKVLFGR
jgi:hypothetical protein